MRTSSFLHLSSLPHHGFWPYYYFQYEWTNAGGGLRQKKMAKKQVLGQLMSVVRGGIEQRINRSKLAIKANSTGPTLAISSPYEIDISDAPLTPTLYGLTEWNGIVSSTATLLALSATPLTATTRQSPRSALSG